MFIAEFLPGGGIRPSFVFKGLNIFRYHNGAGLFVLICEIGFLIFTVIFTRREYRILKKIKFNYFKSAWNWMEIWVVVLSYCSIILYLMKVVYITWILNQIEKSKGKRYIRMMSLAVLDEVLTITIGFLLFIATLKTLKLLKFNRRIGFLSSTLRMATPDILAFSLTFIITLSMFASIFYLTNNTASRDFSSFLNTIKTSIFLITKEFNTIKENSPVVGPLFYFIFAFIMHWVVFQLLIAIICRAFTKVKRDVSCQSNDFEVIDYLTAKIARTFQFIKGGGRVQPNNSLSELENNLNQVDFKLMSIMNKLNDHSDKQEDAVFYGFVEKEVIKDLNIN